jgi:hypothetical protein
MPITDALSRSGSTDAFRVGVEQFLRSCQPNDLVVFDFRCPPVKVERTVHKILVSFPDLPIERITLDATSGCEFFRGRATIDAGEQSVSVRFEWNCRWKAEQMGWADWFGLPDQMRAAREFGYDCFRVWSEEPAAVTMAV